MPSAVFDGAYKEVVDAYAAQPFWLTEAAKIVEAMSELPRDAPVLDVGGHNGQLAALLRLRLLVRAYSIDVNQAAVSAGRQQFRAIKVQHYDGEKLPFGSATFAAVSMMNMLGHVDQPHALLAEVRRVLEPHGLLVLVLPNWSYYGSRINDLTIRTMWSARTAVTLLYANGFRDVVVSGFGRRNLLGRHARLLATGTV